MKKLRNYAAAALAAAVLGTAGLQGAAYAAGDPGAPPPPGPQDQMHRPPMDGAQFERRAEARLARLHDDLKLNADQEPAWKTFADKTKPEPRRAPDWESLSKLSTPDRMEKMLALMRDGVNKMGARVAAVREFYSKLTPDQQKTFDTEYMPRHHRHPEMMRRDGAPR